MSISLSMTRGNTKRWRATVTQDGVALDLTGKALYFMAKLSISDLDAAAILNKSTVEPPGGITVIAPAANGIAEILILPADTVALPNALTVLVWSLELVDGTNVYTLADGALDVRADVRIGT